MATAIEAITTLLTLAGLAYLLLALWGARDFVHYWRGRKLDRGFTPDVSILKPVKGVDPQMYAGLVSNLVQMLREARYEHVLINDSDIYVSPFYLLRVMECFADEQVGMVTAPYIGRTEEGG